MSKTEKELLQTRGILREQDTTIKPGRGPFIQSSELGNMAARPGGMSKAEYITKYGLEKEISELITKIEMRRSRLPKFTFWVCDRCHFRLKLLYDDRHVEKDYRSYCLNCNRMNFVDGGKMRQMQGKEIKAYEEDMATTAKRNRERTFRGAFFACNRQREEQGLKRLTESEFREQQRREFSRATQQAK